MKLFLILAIVVAPPLAAQQKIDRRWPLEADGMVRIYNYSGTVKVTGWNRDSVVVTGTTATFKGFFADGNEKAIKLGVDDVVKGPQPRSDFTIFVPARARVWIRGAATDVDVRDVSGAVDIAVTAGRVHVAGTPAEVYAETLDGDLDVDASPAFFRAHTATGKLTWTGAGDEATLSTVSGAITVNSGRLFRARIESISGDIRYTGAVKADANATFDSHGGNVTLNLAKDAHGEVDVDAPFAEVFGKGIKGPRKDGGPYVFSIPSSGKLALDHGATITVRSFKGKVSVFQQ